MKEQIRGLIEYAQDPRHAESITDGQMLDIMLEQLEKLIK